MFQLVMEFTAPPLFYSHHISISLCQLLRCPYICPSVPCFIFQLLDRNRYASSWSRSTWTAMAWSPSTSSARGSATRRARKRCVPVCIHKIASVTSVICELRCATRKSRERAIPLLFSSPLFPAPVAISPYSSPLQCPQVEVHAKTVEGLRKKQLAEADDKKHEEDKHAEEVLEKVRGGGGGPL